MLPVISWFGARVAHACISRCIGDLDRQSNAQLSHALQLRRLPERHLDSEPLQEFAPIVFRRGMSDFRQGCHLV